jgi:hypothetical protein
MPTANSGEVDIANINPYASVEPAIIAAMKARIISVSRILPPWRRVRRRVNATDDGR